MSEESDFIDHILGNRVDPFEVPQSADRLTAAYLSLSKVNAFQPGDLVTWKKGMSNRRIPRKAEPAIVTRVLTTPVFDGDQRGPYLNEPLDLVLGLIDADGDLIEYHFDSRRFKHFNGEAH